MLSYFIHAPSGGLNVNYFYFAILSPETNVENSVI